MMELSGATRFKTGLRRRSVLGSSVVIEFVSKAICSLAGGGTGAGLESFKIFFRRGRSLTLKQTSLANRLTLVRLAAT